MTFLDYFLGKRIATSDENNQKIGPWVALPVLGLDGLSSSAYGPEAAATVLISLGLAGTKFVLPITIAIVILLTILYLSYRQTISAYPGGGGSYTVAKENLGKFASLLAAAALMLDYILVVAVGISAGVGALVSAVPALQPFTLSLCLLTLVLITIVNLRGIRESGVAFMIPTYLFVGSLFIVLGLGLIKTFLAGGSPIPLVSLPKPSGTIATGVSTWLLLRAFASGCTAMTGVEAVSNGTKAFREPVIENAHKALSLVIFILAFLLLSIAILAKSYGVVASQPGVAGYESLISQLTAAIIGRGFFYFVTIGSIIAVLMLSANTGFADFPRMCQIIARDNYLPHIFAERGRRLVFTYGILWIALVAGGLLILFDGITDNLIPLFAIGAFLAFTLSQMGMVVHWIKNKGSWHAILINAAGAVATSVTLLVILVSKFTEGGWVIVGLIPILLVFFFAIRRHYVGVARQIGCHEPLEYLTPLPPIVLVPVGGWSWITRKAVRFAVNLSPEVYGVHVQNEEGTIPIESQWDKYVTQPALAAGVKPPKLVQLPCPYRRVFGSLIDFIDKIKVENPGREIAVVIPNLVEKRWYHYFLHNQRALLLRAAIQLHGDPSVSVITIPWYLKS
jgi:amino acid transporter